MGKIIVIGSQKGGVGKTTTTHNLAYSLKELGKKVLTVDFDSQANLTTCYGVEDTGALEYTIGHLMMDQMEEEVPESFEDYIQSSEGVDYIPSSIYLSVVDAKLRTEMGAERMLAEVLEPLKSRYDYILIDTCPSLGMLTINALAAADEVIITVNPQLLAMMGLEDFLRTVAKIKKRIIIRNIHLADRTFPYLTFPVQTGYGFDVRIRCKPHVFPRNSLQSQRSQMAGMEVLCLY